MGHGGIGDGIRLLDFSHTINIIKPAPAGWKIGNKAGDSSANGAPKPGSADGLMGCHNEAHYSPLP